MPDFTSCRYLGLAHRVDSLRPWRALTTGRPSALVRPEEQGRVARLVAALLRTDEAVLARSTLHLAWDLFGMLDPERDAVFIDNGAYAVLHWGAERARGRGVAVLQFRHHDAADLRRRLREMPPGRRPVVATDGWCPRCGRSAPIAHYLRATRPRSGILFLDDTQAVGIRGIPGSGPAHRAGAGGTLSAIGEGEPGDIVFGSLAKAFGVPLAFFASDRVSVRRFQRRSETRVHSSPPSLADLAAAEHALVVNRRRGDLLRTRLARRVQLFRSCLASFGVEPHGGPFPVQTLDGTTYLSAGDLYRQLSRRGVRTVLLARDGRHPRQVAVLLTAAHSEEHVRMAAMVVGSVIRLARFRRGGRSFCPARPASRLP